MTGIVYTVPPIPPDPERTTWVEAGALRIGVETRLLDEAELAANYQGREMEEIRAALHDRTVQDGGVSIHVAGAHDGHEYLRFDLFENDPHYHYIEPSGERQTVVQFDRVAMGEMLPWALGQLRHRLPQMLLRAGGKDLVPKLDPARLDACLARVEELAGNVVPSEPPTLIRYREVDWDRPLESADRALRPPEALVAEAQRRGARRKRLLRGEAGFFLNRSSLPPGFQVPAHTHDHDELLVVLAGSCRLDGGQGELGKDDAIAIRANTRYGFTCGSDGMDFLTIRRGEAVVSLDE